MRSEAQAKITSAGCLSDSVHSSAQQVDTKPDWIIWGGFDPIATGHGGNRRSSQLHELISGAGLTAEIRKFVPHRNRIGDLLVALRSGAVRYGMPWKSIGELARWGQLWANVQQQLTESPGAGWLFEHSCRQDVWLMRRVADAGRPVVACPQNIEAVVPNSLGKEFPNIDLRALAREVEGIRSAARTFTISAEDQWLLSIFNIRATLLPYYPPKETVSDLLRVREMRGPTKGEFFLLMGNVENPPTHAGVLEVYRALSATKGNHWAVKVTGRGTERLKETFVDRRFEVLGEIDHQRLLGFLTRAKGALAHSFPTSGVLTRLCECAIAGIPVLGNPSAVKSARWVEGMHVYESVDELVNLLEADLVGPALPHCPTSANREFVTTLRSLRPDNKSNSKASG